MPRAVWGERTYIRPVLTHDHVPCFALLQVWAAPLCPRSMRACPLPLPPRRSAAPPCCSKQAMQAWAGTRWRALGLPGLTLPKLQLSLALS